jgi:hypothetical protein
MNKMAPIARTQKISVLQGLDECRKMLRDSLLVFKILTCVFFLHVLNIRVNIYTSVLREREEKEFHICRDVWLVKKL